MASSFEELSSVLSSVFQGAVPPKKLHLVQALSEVRAGLSARDAALKYRTPLALVNRLNESADPLQLILGGPLPEVDETTKSKVRASLGQLLIGNIAERVFEEIYRDSVGPSELELRDDRGTRGETDYLLFNGHGRQVFRVNIKFHGALFRRAMELVGLDPEDCFALATYKIYAATKRQSDEHLPYIFVIVGVRGLTGERVGADIPEGLVDLAALVRLTPAFSGIRTIEDQIVERLTGDPGDFGFNTHLQFGFSEIRAARWKVIGANRANQLLREMLFDRVYAMKVPRFTMNYRGAELDMHFSLSSDLTPLEDFLKILKDEGIPALVGRLERGTM